LPVYASQILSATEDSGNDREDEDTEPDAPVSAEIARQIAEIMQRPYRKVISSDPEEGFLIEVRDLPGCMTAGETIEDAVGMLPEAMMAGLESVLMAGDPVPEPSVTPEYSGRMLIRMPKSLHCRLIERAHDEGVSANQLAVALLAKRL
jgi:predicted RNase H-like HicB family nuclease